jgi:lipoprotein-releasing system permease protein
MLIIEKREGINILRRLGATKSLIGRVFCLESVYVSAFGAVAGILLGLLLCELQIHYHLIGIPNDNSGNLIINTYPVVVKVTDILLVLLPIAAITAVTSFVASRFARRQIE